MSSPTSSSAAANEGVSSMSYYNDAASELGRKLNIGDRSSPTDDMRTRLQAQRESQTKASSSSRAPAKSSTSKGKGKATAPAEPTRKQPRRESTRHGRDPEPDYSDDDDDDDESDDSDEGSGQAPPQTPRISEQEVRRLTVFAVMSVFEPNRGSPDPKLHLSPYEFTRVDGQSRLNEASRTFRSIVLAQAETTRTAADVARLTQIVPLNGTFWGSRTLEDLQNRATNAMKYFRGDFTPQRDAPDTIREFRRIFMSVEGILRTPPLSTMHPESKTGMVQLLTYILDIIPYTHQDMARVGQQTPVYASGQSEYNLFQRFASSRDDWSACLEAIRRLIALDANLFNADARGNLRNANQRLDYNRASGYASNQSAVDFIARFKLIIQGLPGVV